MKIIKISLFFCFIAAASFAMNSPLQDLIMWDSKKLEEWSKKDLNDATLKELIERIEQGKLDGDAPRLLARLTNIALENPFNLLARGYLWLINDKNNKNFFFSKEYLSSNPKILGGKTVQMAAEFSKGPKLIKDFIFEQFLYPSFVGCSIMNEVRPHLSHMQNKKLTVRNIKTLTDQQKDTIDLIKERRKHLQGMFRVRTCALFSECSDFTDPREKLSSSLIDNFLVYLNNKDTLIDGKIEYELISKHKNFFDNILILTAQALGNSDAFLKVFGTSGELPEEIRFEYLIYSAKIIGKPEAYLVLGGNLLNNKIKTLDQEDGTSFLDYSLSLEEAPRAWEFDDVISPISLDHKQIKETIYRLPLVYLNEEKSYSDALFAMAKAWKLGYLPDDELRESFHFSPLSNKKEIEHVLSFYKNGRMILEYDFHDIPMMFHCLLGQYKEANQDFIKDLFRFIALKDEKIYGKLDDKIFAHIQDTFFHNFSIFMSDEKFWRNEIISHFDIVQILKKLEILVPEDELDDYYCWMHLLTSYCGDKESFSYLEKAAAEGHPLAECVFTLDSDIKAFLTTYLSALKKVFQIPLAEAAPARESDLASKTKDESQNEKPIGVPCVEAVAAEPKLKTQDSCVPCKEAVAEKPKLKAKASCINEPNFSSAINNIRFFIKKWTQPIPGAKRKELIADFRYYVLANKEINSGTSLKLHGNHGRRKDKYGNRASTFEITTLLERAEKFLQQLPAQNESGLKN